MAYVDMAIVSVMEGLLVEGSKNYLEANGVEVMGFTPIYDFGRKGSPVWRFMVNGKSELRDFRSPRTAARHWVELQMELGA